MAKTTKYTLTVTAADAHVFKAIKDSDYKFYVGKVHKVDGYHKHESIYDQRKKPWETSDDNKNTFTLEFDGPILEYDYYATFQDPNSSTPNEDGIEKIEPGQVYILTKDYCTIVAKVTWADWVRGPNIGFSNDIAVIPVVYRVPKGYPQPRPGSEDCPSPLKGMKLWVPGSGLLKLPHVTSKLDVWLETDPDETYDEDDDEDTLGRVDQSLELEVRFKNGYGNNRVATVQIDRHLKLAY